jgi:transcriptional regulator with XRE-family HTH domain
VAIMPGVRRSSLAIETERRMREQRLRLGAEVRSARERRGLTRTALADRAGIGRMVVSRIERGLTNLDLAVLQRIGLALQRPVVVSFGRDLEEGPVDAGHLAMQELVLRLGRAAGYDGSFELPTRPAEAWRSADVGLASQATRRMVLVECWNSIGDVGAAARSTSRKQADLEALAIARWGDEAQIGVVWVVRATARNRALIHRYPEVFAARFPGSSRAWLDALTAGARFPVEPGLVWSDVGAPRLFAWRR